MEINSIVGNTGGRILWDVGKSGEFIHQRGEVTGR